MNQFKSAKNKLVTASKNFWADESAQGMTEYILLLVVVLAIAFVFKDKIQATVTAKLESVGGDIQKF